MFRGEGPGKASSDLRASGAWKASPNTCLQGLCSSRPAPGRAEASREGQEPGSAPRVGPLPFPLTHFFRRLTGSTSQPEAALPEDGGPFVQLRWGLCCCLGPPQQSPTCSWQAPAEEAGTAPMSPPVPETSFLREASLGVIPHRQTLGRAFRVLCRKPPPPPLMLMEVLLLGQGTLLERSLGMPTCKHDLFLCKRRDFKINLACGACPSSPRALIREEVICPRAGGSIPSLDEPGGPGQHTWEVAVLPHCWSRSPKRPQAIFHVFTPSYPAQLESGRPARQTLPQPRSRHATETHLRSFSPDQHRSHDDHPHFTHGEAEAREV